MASDDDPFAPPKEEEVPLQLATPLVQSPRGDATRRAHEEFLRRSRPQAGGTSLDTSSSYSESREGLQLSVWRWARMPIVLLLGWFTLGHLMQKGEWVFIDGANLLFHEAGHLVFSFGTTVTALGGTLMQLALPLLFVLYFSLHRRDAFAGGACAWWLAENLVNIARYMHDAPVEELPLVGGTIQDWTFLFTRWGMLRQARDIADLVRLIGLVGMGAALAFLLYKVLRPSSEEVRRSASVSS